MATKRSQQQMAANKKHAVMVSLKFNKMLDYDIVDWLKNQNNKQGAIKDAIRYYIDAEKGGLV